MEREIVLFTELTDIEQVSLSGGLNFGGTGGAGGDAYAFSASIAITPNGPANANSVATAIGGNGGNGGNAG